MEKIYRKSIKPLKTARDLLTQKKSDSVPVFIFGYGRSGTTALNQCFERDFRVTAYPERSHLVMKDWRIDHRLTADAILRAKTKIVTFKPILDSLSILFFQQLYPNCKIIWMIRGVNDVVNSAIRKFGGNVGEYLQDIVSKKNNDNWISAQISQKILTKLMILAKSARTSEDWQALVWWVVNQTPIEVMDEIQFENFLVVEYEYLVTEPKSALNRIYSWLGMPESKCAANFFDRVSIGKGRKVRISGEIKKYCDQSWHWYFSHREINGWLFREKKIQVHR